jgi:hypothetical protein
MEICNRLAGKITEKAGAADIARAQSMSPEARVAAGMQLVRLCTGEIERGFDFSYRALAVIATNERYPPEVRGEAHRMLSIVDDATVAKLVQYRFPHTEALIAHNGYGSEARDALGMRLTEKAAGLQCTQYLMDVSRSSLFSLPVRVLAGSKAVDLYTGGKNQQRMLARMAADGRFPEDVRGLARSGASSPRSIDLSGIEDRGVLMRIARTGGVAPGCREAAAEKALAGYLEAGRLDLIRNASTDERLPETARRSAAEIARSGLHVDADMGKDYAGAVRKRPPDAPRGRARLPR